MRDLTLVDPRATLRVAVFCGAARPADPAHLQAADTVGRLLAEHRIHLLYGGSRIGQMGALADAALAAGGHVTGIMPRAFNTPRITHPGLTTLETVPDMTARKQRLTDQADAFLALPGGFGTLDELAHVWAGAAQGARTRPVGLLNTQGYYAPLLNFLNTASAAGFLSPHPHLRLDTLAVVDDDPARLVQRITSRIAPPPVPHSAAVTGVAR